MFRSLAAGVAIVILPSLTSAQLRSEVYVSGLSAPVAFVQDPIDPAVQFVAEQAGRVRIIRSGILLDELFLDLRNDVVTGGERGLLGLVFAPDHAESRRLYVNFTGPGGHTVIARYTRSVNNVLRADPGSRFDLQFEEGQRFIAQPFENHNGGDLQFGPDGYLYIGLGDGGGGNDPDNRAQDPASLLGKMLRLDVSVPDDDEVGYRVPADNPSEGSIIWALGLRNPWRFTFDSPALGGNGALIIADVGQNAWEEINYEPAGAGGRNYGWRIREGGHPNQAFNDPTTEGLTDPVIAYPHAVGRSVTGGPVYRGTDLGPVYAGRYFFGDITGKIWSAAFTIGGDGEVVGAHVEEHTADLGGQGTLGLVSTFGIDASCRLYIVNLAGTIFRVQSPSANAVAGCAPGVPLEPPGAPRCRSLTADERLRMPREALRRLCGRSR
jgi:glucose/arabinose dehydrogenase